MVNFVFPAGRLEANRSTPTFVADTQLEITITIPVNAVALLWAVSSKNGDDQARRIVISVKDSDGNPVLILYDSETEVPAGEYVSWPNTKATDKQIITSPLIIPGGYKVVVSWKAPSVASTGGTGNNAVYLTLLGD